MGIDDRHFLRKTGRLLQMPPKRSSLTRMPDEMGFELESDKMCEGRKKIATTSRRCPAKHRILRVLPSCHTIASKLRHLLRMLLILCSYSHWLYTGIKNRSSDRAQRAPSPRPLARMAEVAFTSCSWFIKETLRIPHLEGPSLQMARCLII
ncbi:hypothetical protein FPV67DRAFT_853976 [Lyophyllum atratum]|nr:hypothetical protein FPV67DRAFT_853976 [Lyophyllum atratum]